MNNEHPITPPPELFRQWEGMPRSLAFEAAYRACADTELDACCEWLQDPDLNVDTYKLRSARRPKPPGLKEQALAKLEAMERLWEASGNEPSNIIRRALELLPDEVV